MTLQELWMIVVRGWKLVLVAVLACMVACGGYYMVAKHGSASYSATSYIVANSQVSGVSGLATDEARRLAVTSASEGVDVKVKSESTTMTVTITATGPDAEACVKAANEVAESANAAAERAYSDWETPYMGSATLAQEANYSSAGNLLKYLLVAVFAGLFVSVCILVVFDMARRSVKTPEGAQEVVGLPVLEILPAKNGERLLANVRFSLTYAGEEARDQASSVLVVPSGEAAAADAACALLREAAAAEGAKFEVRQAEPFSQGMAAAYAARDVDAVVVTASQWTDTLPQLESTVAELRLAGAQLAGIVFSRR